MSSSVVVVGSFNVDHVWRCESLPAPGATIAGRYSTGPGGKGFNQAVAACRAGADTHFVCALGDDAGGATARELAAQDGFGLIAEASSEPTGAASPFETQNMTESTWAAIWLAGTPREMAALKRRAPSRCTGMPWRRAMAAIWARLSGDIT